MNRLTKECQQCLYDKNKNGYPDQTPSDQVVTYQQRIQQLINERVDLTGPEIVHDIRQIKLEMFNIADDYTEIKHYYNQYMMQKEAAVLADIKAAKDPLYRAMEYAMAGNYIDFGATNHVDNNKLESLLNNVSYELNQDVYQSFCHDLANAHSLVYLVDNCGEIVLDKLLIQQIKEAFPGIDITVIVRGLPAVNDATMEDAKEVHLDDIVRVIGNGSGIAGNSLRCISKETRSLIENGDIVFSKGQGNYETLQYESLNIYFLFLCKCQLFTKRFHMSRYGGVLTKHNRCQ